MQEATKYANEIAKKENDEALRGRQDFRQDRVHRLTRRRTRRGRRRSSRCTRRMEARIGKDMITAIHKETDADPNGL